MNLPEHPLIGKLVDTDWRKPAEQSLPYDEHNTNVDQRLLVVDARLSCYGDTWLFFKDRQIPQKEKRVCKVHE